MGWDVQGVHPLSEDGTHVNFMSIHDGVLVSCDDFGLINFFNYPAIDSTHKGKSFGGHSEHVLRAEFNEDGSKVFTVGGMDRTIIQWAKV